MGNYNFLSVKVYIDVSFFSVKNEIVNDIIKFFYFLFMSSVISNILEMFFMVFK